MSAQLPEESLRTYRGACHCGLVEFEFRAVVRMAVECNCSYCRRKAALHHRVAGESFALLKGADALATYQFGTHRARHQFCRVCGSHTHCHPRSAPDQVNVNLRCVDELDPPEQHVSISQYDGRSWNA